MEFYEDGALEVSMFKYLWNVINKFPEVIMDRASTPAHDRCSRSETRKKPKN